LKARAQHNEPELLYLFEQKTGRQISRKAALKNNPHEVEIDETVGSRHVSVMLAHSHPGIAPPSESDWDNIVELPWLTTYVTVTAETTYALLKQPDFKKPAGMSAKTYYLHYLREAVKKSGFGHLGLIPAIQSMSENELRDIALEVNLEMTKRYGIAFKEVVEP